MAVLGIDTSGRRAGAALLGRGGEVLACAAPATGSHSASLAPGIAGLLRDAGLAPAEVELVGVARGPGSYTGLRVGIVTAKAFGRAVGATVLGVPTLEVMAAQAPEDAPRVLVVLRAYKRRVLVARFRRDVDGKLELVEEAGLLQAESVPRGEPEAVLVTDAADLLAGLLGCDREVRVDEPLAAAVARHAMRRASAGTPDETASLTPVYLLPPSVTLPGAR